MKKIVIIIVSILILSGITISVFALVKDKNQNSSINITDNITDNTSENVSYNNVDNTRNILNAISNTSIPNNTIENTIKEKTPEEIEVSRFSTTLKGDEARLNNINITCNTLNGATINPGDTFSFNSIVGMPSAEKGYMEADVFVNKKTEKGYGGGNCQVSTTIYNAALQVEGLSIVERNPHKKKVSYIEEGKDAAVSYSGGLDLKFRNDTGKIIKVYVSADSDSVDAFIKEVS